ncbi:MAG: LytTR family transcriptional regulator DNA-binding domain-containing protein [Lachnospiraceae bacterium]|nr:LytTR family transcriptional regulator DNA-binding domain-containing protein [Lachnospiraceae bacterium]
MEIITRQTDGKPLTIIIEYPRLDPKTQKVIQRIRTLDYKVRGDNCGTIFQIPISDIYYMESVERKTFFYTKDEVYLTDKKLYELEELLKEAGIIRISKSCLICQIRFHKIHAAAWLYLGHLAYGMVFYPRTGTV